MKGLFDEDWFDNIVSRNVWNSFKRKYFR
jgi:hypothetical protein